MSSRRRLRARACEPGLQAETTWVAAFRTRCAKKNAGWQTRQSQGRAARLSGVPNRGRIRSPLVVQVEVVLCSFRGAYDKAVAVFPSFMKDVHGESLAGSMVSKRPSARILSGTVLLVYDRSVAALRVVDPLLRAAGQTQPVIQHERPAAILRFVEILCAVRRLSSTLGDQRRSSGFSSADNHRRHDRQTKHPQRP